jgi:hypothetical protein
MRIVSVGAIIDLTSSRRKLPLPRGTAGTIQQPYLEEDIDRTNWPRGIVYKWIALVASTDKRLVGIFPSILWLICLTLISSREYLKGFPNRQKCTLGSLAYVAD